PRDDEGRDESRRSHGCSPVGVKTRIVFIQDSPEDSYFRVHCLEAPAARQDRRGSRRKEESVDAGTLIRTPRPEPSHGRWRSSVIGFPNPRRSCSPQLRPASRCSSRSVWRRVEPRRDKSNVSRHPGPGELASSSPVFAWIFADQVAPIVRVGAENERELVRFHLCVSEASAIVSTLTRSMNALSRFALWTSSRSWRWRPSP